MEKNSLDQQSPYETPQADLQSIDTAVATLPLYRTSGILIATFLGTPLAGVWTLSHNLRAVGLREKVAAAWAMAIAIMVACLVLAALLPDDLPVGVPFALAQVACLKVMVDKLLGDREKQHGQSGGQFRSNWRAAGVGLLFGLGLFVVFAAAMLMIFPELFTEI